jgi:hypothetical protein
MLQPYYPQRQRFWTKGKAVLALAAVIVIVIAVVGVATNMPYLKEGSSIFLGMEQRLYKNGDNNTVVQYSNDVKFAYSTLTCQDNKSCGVIFASVVNCVLEVRQKMASGNDKIWTPTGGSANTLKTVEPYVDYYVKVSADCTLQLKSCIPQS